MTIPRTLQALLERRVRDGTVPGAVALVSHGDRTESAVAGHADTAGTTAMTPDTLFRLASLTKPVVAAAVLTLLDEGALALEDPVSTWLPELADPVVVRTPQSPLDDVVPAERPITVLDVLTSRAGYGFPDDFTLPAVTALMTELLQGPPQPQWVAPPDAWLATLAGIPLLRQPGEAWLYNLCSDLQGVLISRVSGRPLPEFLAERIFTPLAMTDTGFAAPPGATHRLAPQYDAGLQLLDAPDGQWSTPPPFPSGAGGLVSTARDWAAFARMLLAGGSAPGGGPRVLSREAVRLLTTDHLTAAQRAAARLFLEGQGWGFGGSVDVAVTVPGTVPGRYGWVGGTGTSGHIVPATGTVALLLTQREMAGPTPTPLMREFWQYAAAGAPRG